MPVSRGKGHAGALVHCQRGRDVEQHGTAHGFGVVGAEPVRHARAAVVAAQRKAREAELRHQPELVLGHGALAVALMPGIARRRRTAAVAAQVGGDHGEVVGQRWRHPVPDQVALRMAVQQQQRRAGAALHAGDLDLADAVPERLEIWEQQRAGVVQHGLSPLLGRLSIIGANLAFSAARDSRAHPWTVATELHQPWAYG
ncbi:hypothetical protein D9M70_512270 [compost metagenome]